MFSDKIKMARKIAGLSLRQLSEHIGMSAQALSKYETNKSTPNLETISKISAATKLPIDYFFQTEFKIDPDRLKVEYRKKTRLTKKSEELIKARIAHWAERYMTVESYFEKEEKSRVFRVNYIDKLEDIEDIVMDLREKLELGIAPLGSVIELLEENGIKVLIMECPEEISLEEFKNFDGMSFEEKGNFFIVVNGTLPLSRQVFSLLHELGHLILKFNKDVDKKSKEDAADIFAGAFLVPQKAAKKEFYKLKNRNKPEITFLTNLLSLKNKYKLSVQGWIMRFKGLNLISSEQCTSFYIELSQRGWRKKEPGDDIMGIDTTDRLNRLIYEAWEGELISISKAAVLLNKKNISELRDEWTKSGLRC